MLPIQAPLIFNLHNNYVPSLLDSQAKAILYEWLLSFGLCKYYYYYDIVHTCIVVVVFHSGICVSVSDVCVKE